jgi:hypothetical protein
MGCSAYAVHVGHERSGSNECVDKRELVRDRGEAVIVHECQGERTRKFMLAVQKDTFVGNKHIVEKCRCLHHQAL